jgi:hypothetical protein
MLSAFSGDPFKMRFLQHVILAAILLAPGAAFAQQSFQTTTGNQAPPVALMVPTGATDLYGHPIVGLPSVSAPLAVSVTGGVPVATKPGSVIPTTQAAGTVTTGGTFQQVLAANTSRTQCTIQNTSTHTAYAYWLTSGTASLLNSLQISAGGLFQCASSSAGPIQTAIQWTTSTTADPFNYSESQ